LAKLVSPFQGCLKAVSPAVSWAAGVTISMKYSG